AFGASQAGEDLVDGEMPAPLSSSAVIPPWPLVRPHGHDREPFSVMPSGVDDFLRSAHCPRSSIGSLSGWPSLLAACRSAGCDASGRCWGAEDAPAAACSFPGVRNRFQVEPPSVVGSPRKPTIRAFPRRPLRYSLPRSDLR